MDTSFDVNQIKGLLLDLDGVLYVGDKAIDGAAETIQYLRLKHLPLRFCTNTTILSNKSLLEKLGRMGLSIEPHELYGAISAAVSYLRRYGRPRCFFLVTDDPGQDFAEFPEDDKDPEFIILGDVGKQWDYELMQKVFHLVVRGARMVALHKGRYWETSEGLRMDVGAFVAGLEYVTGQTATLIGKPSRDFFELAVKDMRLRPSEVAMVGDDINSDIGGAQQAGMKAILVETGKYRAELAARAGITPDLILDSVTALREIF